MQDRNMFAFFLVGAVHPILDLFGPLPPTPMNHLLMEFPKFDEKSIHFGWKLKRIYFHFSDFTKITDTVSLCQRVTDYSNIDLKWMSSV